MRSAPLTHCLYFVATVSTAVPYEHTRDFKRGNRTKIGSKLGTRQPRNSNTSRSATGIYGCTPIWLYQGTALLPIAFPADLPPGEYQVVLGLYTQPDGARVPLAYAPGGPLPESVAGPDAIQPFRFTVGPRAAFVQR
jgi:hypothetical protein